MIYSCTEDFKDVPVVKGSKLCSFPKADVVRITKVSETNLKQVQ